MKNKIYDIVIIGGGPGGIGCAIESAAHKIGEILLIEKLIIIQILLENFIKIIKELIKIIKVK